MSNRKRRNHYIPRLLLNRFASRVSAQKQFVWQFQNVRNPIEVSTKDAAVGSFFYGKPENQIEDTFADLEGEQARLLGVLDAGTDPNDVVQSVRSLVWLLFVRTRAMRERYAKTGAQFLEVLEESAQTNAAKTQFTKKLTGGLAEEIQKRFPNLPSETRASLCALGMQHIKDVDFGLMMKSVLSEARKGVDLRSVAADGQVRGISKLIIGNAPAVPPTFLEMYRWSMLVRPPRTFILSDACAFAVRMSNGEIEPLNASDDAASVYLPISHSQLLIGRRGETLPLLSDDEINRASAGQSFDTFFASENTPYLRALVSRIGTNAVVFSKERLAKIVEDCWGDEVKPEE